MSNVSPKLAVRSALKTIEGNVAWNDVSFQSSLGNFFRKISCHDHLVFHSAGSQLAGGCISAVESHKSIFLCIIIFSFDFAVIDRSWNGIVDIQKCNGILADHSTDIFAYSSPDIYFTGNRNSSSCKTAVYIAGNESELCLECRPTFCCQGYIFSGTFMCLYPIQQSDLVLSQFWQDFRLHIAFAQFFLHIFCNFFNTWIPFMFLKGFKKIQFRVLFDLDSQVIQSLDRSVAGQEVLRTGTKADHFQVL